MINAMKCFYKRSVQKKKSINEHHPTVISPFLALVLILP